MARAKGTTQNKVSKRTPRTRHRIKTTWDELYDAGRDPTKELIRIADKAEDAEEYATAANIWKELKSYIDAKMKAINPSEERRKEQSVVSLEDLNNMKAAIMRGDLALVDDSQAIDHHKIVKNVKADDLL